MFIRPEEVQWKKVKYLKSSEEGPEEQHVWDYELWLNEPLASWDVFSYWEKERIRSMEKQLVKGDIMFDVGTEQGWCNIIYARLVGPENMVLIEPTPEFWPNIKAIWEKNYAAHPLNCYPGFFSDKTTSQVITKNHVWPEESDDDLIDRNGYKNLFEPKHRKEVRQITLDDFVKKSGITPQAITIDVEGAELLVLRGAEKTLKRNALKVWVSEHDDMAFTHYGISSGSVAAFMKSLGYNREVLALDHERHVFYSK